MEAKPLQAQQKVIDRLRVGRPADDPWANVHGPNFKTDNSASLINAQRIGREGNEATAKTAAATAVQVQADAQAALLPRPLTEAEQRERDMQIEYSKRFNYALGNNVRRATGPASLPEVPADAR
jgi:hypothetical protein